MNPLSPPDLWDKIWNKQIEKGYGNLALRSAVSEDKIKWLKNILPPFEKSNVLETGCGNGIFLNTFREAFSLERAVGIDFSSEAIHIARHLFSDKMEFIQSDVVKMPFKDEEFSTIISLGLIEHFSDPKIPLSETLRVLKKGGYLILMTPNKHSFGKIDRKVKQLLKKWEFGYQTEYSKKELKNIAANLGLEVIHTETRQRCKTKNEKKSMKMIRSFDKILSHFSPSFGFYSWIIAQKK